MLTEEEKKLKKKEYERRRYLKNKEKVCAQVREYYWRNKEKIYKNRSTEEAKEIFALKKREWRKKNHPRSILHYVKSRAVKNNIPFNLTLEDIQIPEFCPVFSFPLVVNEKVHKYNSLSVDRIDPDLGYVKGNVQIISYLANTMKQNATKEQLLMFAKWVQEQYDTMD
jgi:hypothetical protein